MKKQKDTMTSIPEPKAQKAPRVVRVKTIVIAIIWLASLVLVYVAGFKSSDVLNNAINTKASALINGLK